jgi:uncharacterized membrane protein YjfL (UPF0719 family)
MEDGGTKYGQKASARAANTSVQLSIKGCLTGWTNMVALLLNDMSSLYAPSIEKSIR